MANSWKTNLTASLEAAEVNGRTAFPTFGTFERPSCVPLHLSTSSELPSLSFPSAVGCSHHPRGDSWGQ